MTQKSEVRASARALRQQAHDAAGPGRAGVLSSLLAGYRGVPLAGYMPIHSEIPPLAAMEEAAAHGPVAVPVIVARGQPLRFARWEPGCAMQEGAFGAMIPLAQDWIVPEILIVPMLAFDARGYRLGYGGGFYDRTLELLRSHGPVLAVGFAYAAQELPEVPIEPTDQPLDLIVTERGVITPTPLTRP